MKDKQKYRLTFGSKTAFTLVEILIAVALLGVFLIGVGTFFLQGNKAAAKGTWRLHTTARVRSGMKLIQRAFDGTAYPSYTGPNQFLEMKPTDTEASQYDLKFGLDFSADATEPVSFVAGEFEGTILEFTSATPYQLNDDGSVASMGATTKYTLSFPLQADKPAKVVKDGNKGIETATQELIILAEEGSYEYSSGAFAAPTLNGKQTRVRIPDVHKITFSIFQAYPNPEYANEPTGSSLTPEAYPKITLNVELDCRDPFDARLKIVQNLIYQINTQVRGP